MSIGPCLCAAVQYEWVLLCEIKLYHQCHVNGPSFLSWYHQCNVKESFCVKLKLYYLCNECITLPCEIKLCHRCHINGFCFLSWYDRCNVKESFCVKLKLYHQCNIKVLSSLCHPCNVNLSYVSRGGGVHAPHHSTFCEHKCQLLISHWPDNFLLACYTNR